MVQEKKRKKQTLILNATIDLIAENGFHASPASQIAERAGVGIGTIYRYFENKDVLIHEVFKYIEKRMIKDVFQHDDDSLPVKERFTLILTKLISYLVEHPNDFNFLEQFYDSPYGIKKRREDSLMNNNDNWNPLKKLLDNAKNRQIIKDMPRDMLCGFFFGPITFMIKDHFVGIIDLNNGNIKMIVEACWDAIKI